MGTTGLYRPPLPKPPRLIQTAAAMRMIKTQRTNVTWLQGPGPSDLWTWTDDHGAYQAHEFTFFSRTVLWKDGKLMTGLCLGGDGGAASYTGKTGLIAFDSVLAKDTLKAALLMLNHLESDLATEKGVVALRSAIEAV